MELHEIFGEAHMSSRARNIKTLCDWVHRPELAEGLIRSDRSLSDVVQHLSRLKAGADAWGPIVDKINASMV